MGSLLCPYGLLRTGLWDASVTKVRGPSRHSHTSVTCSDPTTPAAAAPLTLSPLVNRLCPAPHTVTSRRTHTHTHTPHQMKWKGRLIEGRRVRLTMLKWSICIFPSWSEGSNLQLGLELVRFRLCHFALSLLVAVSLRMAEKLFYPWNFKRDIKVCCFFFFCYFSFF